MNKGELIDAIATKAAVTKKDADAALSATLETIVESVSAGDKVTLVGFGSFEPRELTSQRFAIAKRGKGVTLRVGR